MKKTSFVLFFLALIGFSFHSFSQSNRWKAHTSFREAVDIASSQEALWVATTGGLYSYQFDSGEITTYTTIEGLHQVIISAIIYDEEADAVWIGYGDGVLDRLDVQSGEINSFFDIARATQFNRRNINRMFVHESSLFIATGFGVVVWDTQANEVKDSYTQFNTLTAGIQVNDVIVAPLYNQSVLGLWVGTDEGLAVASLEASNLQFPEIWEIDTRIKPILSLGNLGDRIFAGTESDGFELGGDSEWFGQGFSGSSVTRIQKVHDKLLVTTPFWVWQLSNTTRTRVSVNGLFTLQGATLDSSGNLWVADGEASISKIVGVPQSGEITTDVAQVVLPNGPYHRLFEQLVFDTDWNLWGVATYEMNGGFYTYSKSSGWTSFIRKNSPGLANKFRFNRIHVDQNNTVWIGSSVEGQGLVSYDVNGNFKHFDDANSTLRPVPNQSSTDIRISGIASDKSNNLWAINFLTSPRVSVKQGETWTGLSSFRDQNGNSVFGDFSAVKIDSFGQIWLSLRLDRGVLVIDPKETATDISDDVSKWYSQRGANGLGLSGTQVNAVEEDLKGGIWLGTDRGISTFIFGNLATSSEPSWLVKDGAYVYRDLYVNDLEVDASNQMWIGTPEGAWLIDGTTYELIEHFTTKNSPLFSNNVIDIEVDSQSGYVYFSTDDGLISWLGNAVLPQVSANKLKIYPNPAQGSASSLPQITIENLVAATTLKIISVSGELLKTLQTGGGRVVWDGKDEQGKLVASGIYLFVAVGENGEGTSVGKLAVIR